MIEITEEVKSRVFDILDRYAVSLDVDESGHIHQSFNGVAGVGNEPRVAGSSVPEIRRGEGL